MKVNNVGILACPRGFEPLTCCLEGSVKHRNINANSNILTSCSSYRPANESIGWFFVGIYKSAIQVLP